MQTQRIKTAIYKILLYSFIIAALLFGGKGYGQGYIAASRYLGGDGTESVSQIVVNNGESYVFGSSVNTDPTNNTYPITIGTFNGLADMVVTKLDANGVIIWSRFLGGNLSDYSNDIKYFNGALYITGISESSNYPVTDNSTLVGLQAPVYTKLNSNTGAIEFSTYLQDYNTSPRIDITEGVVYLYGTKIISITNEDIYITKFNAASNTFINSITFGGTNIEHISTASNWFGVAGQYNNESLNENFIVQGGIIYLVCNTRSSDFPVTDVGVFSGLVKSVYVKLNNTTGVIQFATYLGETNSNSSPNGICINNGYAYLYYESNYEFHSTITCFNSTTNMLQYSKELTSFNANVVVQSGIIYVSSTSYFNENYDEVFTKLDANNGNEIFSIVLASAGGGEMAVSLKVVNGDAYLLGQTTYSFRDSYPTGFPITNGFYPITNRNLLITLTKIGANNKICFSTYLGGTEAGDGAALISNSLVVDNSNVYLSGYISADFFPVTITDFSGNYSDPNFFWAKFEMNPTMPAVPDNLLPSTQTTCKNGIATEIMGDEIIFPSSMMPIVYKNGIPGSQNAIPLKYQWQKANSSTGPWADIIGGIEQNYTPIVGLVNQYYRRLAFASVCGGTPISTSSVAEVIINGNTAPNITLGNIINTCAGSSVTLGGTPTAIGIGGATIASYLWAPASQTFMPSSTVSNPVVTPASNTVYSVTVTDNNGCKKVGLQLVNAYVANAGLDVSSCVGGIVRIGTSAIAGLPGVMYNWVANPADPTMSCNTCAQPDVHPLTPTTYTLTLTIPKTGGGICSTTDAVLVTPISAPTNADFAGPDRTVCAGSVTILGTSSMEGFSYSWTPSYFLNSNNISNPICTIVTNSPFPNPTGYRVTATKAGCVFEDSVKVTLVGAVARAGEDGCGPRTLGYPDDTPTINETYQWTVVNGVGRIIGATNTPQINVGTSIGTDVTYRLTVTLNGVSCTDDVIVPVCACQSPTINVLAQYGCANYNTNAGNVKLVASRTIPSTFTWSPAAGLSNAIGDTVTLTDNVQRTYIVTATSIIDTSEHCTSIINVNNPSANSAPVFTAQDVFSCPGVGVSIGQVIVAGYTYIWEEITLGTLSSTASSNPTATVNSTSIFPVLVTNTLTGCTLRDTATVTIIDLPSNLAGTDAKICGAGGIAQLGLPPVAGLTYSWAPAAGLQPNNTTANPTINVTNTTTFNVVATNNSTGCSVTDDVTVTVSPTIPAFSFTPVTYCPSTSGALALPAGPQGMATYNWTPNYLVLNSNSNGPVATTQSTPPSTATTFTLNVTNAGGCTSSASVLFTPTSTSPVAGNSRTLCKNATTQLGAAAQPGIYSWTQIPAVGGSLNSNSISNPVFTPTAEGIYKFIVTKLTAGCTTKDSVIINVTEFILPQIPSLIVCQNSFVPIGTNFNPPGTQYFWSPTTGLNNASISNPIASVTTNSVAYTLTAIGVNGCIASQNMFVTVNPSPSHTVTVAPISACVGTTGLSLNPVISPAGSYNYLWSNNNGLSNIYAPNPTVSLSTIGTRNYNVVVTNNSTGCATTASTTVTANACTLPIKLESFTAVPQDKTVLLRWVVTEEINVLKYEIEFSTDGRNFWLIGNKAATKSTNYNLVHNSPVFGINYYRLKTIDRDGKISYSEIRTVNFKLAGSLTIYPNPANNLLYITFAPGSINKSATIGVIAMDGKLMYQKNINKLSQTEMLDVSKLANGCYIVRILTNKEVINKSVVVYR